MIDNIEIYEDKIRIFYNNGYEVLVIEEKLSDFFARLSEAYLLGGTLNKSDEADG